MCTKTGTDINRIWWYLSVPRCLWYDLFFRNEIFCFQFSLHVYFTGFVSIHFWHFLIPFNCRIQLICQFLDCKWRIIFVFLEKHEDFEILKNPVLFMLSHPKDFKDRYDKILVEFIPEKTQFWKLVYFSLKSNYQMVWLCAFEFRIQTWSIFVQFCIICDFK